jgi:hypothetical protein
LIAIGGCVKKPSYPDTPHIELKSVSKTTVNLPSTGGVSTDTVQFTLAFTNGDGDFGVPDGTLDTTCADCSCLDHSTDSRVLSNTSQNVFYYTYTSGYADSCISIPGIGTKYIPVSSKYSALQGDITFSISVECPGTGTVDTLSYSFIIKDRAGHFSNRVRSQGIVINCN